MRTLTKTSPVAPLAMAAALVAALTAAPRDAEAQTPPPGFAVNRFEPAERGSDWFAADSLDFRGKVRPAFGLTADYSYRPFVVLNPGGSVNRSIVRNVLFLHPGASVVLFERLRLGLNLPIQAGVDGHTATVRRANETITVLPPPRDGALGDLRFGADVRLFGKYRGPISMAVGMQAWAPTGSTAQYAGDGEWRVRPRVIVAGEAGAFVYSGQVGFTYRQREESVIAGKIGDDVNLTVAAGARLAKEKLVIGPELWASTVLEDAFGRKSTPVEGALGAHYLINDSLRIGAGVGAGFTRAYGAPVSRALVSIEWSPRVRSDRDHDGVSDNEDACPERSGVRTNDPRTNGCPPEEVAPPPPPAPADTDHDGVPDSEDACPTTAGTKTNDPKTNGCKDSDGDGIFDPVDACPAERGVASADPKVNGCPDEDGDGIADKDDACPTIKGVADPDKQKNGCPANFDRDKDGIPNNVDACPDDPGKPDPDPLKNGCPKAFVSAGQIKILEQVQFKLGSAKIETTQQTQATLQAILKVLKEHPEITHVRIEGHTDNTGSAKVNKKLSADRAAAVMKWLVGAGVAKDRLTSAGFGAERPIDTNATEQGRKTNRRVELHID